jgi:hypothetical protein
MKVRVMMRVEEEDGDSPSNEPAAKKRKFYTNSKDYRLPSNTNNATSQPQNITLPRNVPSKRTSKD